MIKSTRYFRLEALLMKAVLVFTLLSIIPDAGCAQSKNSFNKRMNFEEGRYHFEKGWVNSVGVHLSPFTPFLIAYQITDGIGQTLPTQIDYIGYMLVKPKLGLGVSMSLTNHPTGELGYEYFSHFKFVDVAAYSKLYLGNYRGRPFVDFKLGYGIAKDNPIVFSCFGCEEVGPLYLRYSSGLMYQPGIGVEFATYNRVKWGMKLSLSINKTTKQRDLHKNSWRNTPEGIIKRSTRDSSFGALFFGFNIYF